MIIKKSDQKGIVSIIVTLITVVVLTLLVIGLAQIGISENKSAFKLQQSTEAFYNSESGINYILNYLKAGNSISSCTCICQDFSGNNLPDPLGFALNINAASVPCIMVNDKLTDYLFNINNGYSKVFGYNKTGGISKIKFNWTPPATSANPDYTLCVNNKFTSSDSWNCPAPVLMISVFAFNGNVSVNDTFNESIAPNPSGSDAFTFYLFPTNNPSTSISSGLTDINNILAGSCNNAINGCSSTITALPKFDNYFFRVTPIYAGTNLSVSAIDSAGNGIVTDQIEIDSTGKSGNTLQRLDSRISRSYIYQYQLANQNKVDQTPLYSIQSETGICKLFEGYYLDATPTGSSIDSPDNCN